MTTIASVPTTPPPRVKPQPATSAAQLAALDTAELAHRHFTAHDRENHRLAALRAQAIDRAYRSGLTMQTIAARLQIDVSQVSRVLAGRQRARQRIDALRAKKARAKKEQP